MTLLHDRVAWCFFGAFLAVSAGAAVLTPGGASWDGHTGLAVVVVTFAVAAFAGYHGVAGWQAGNFWGVGGVVWMAGLCVFSGSLGVATTIGLTSAETTELTVVHTWGRTGPARVRDLRVRFVERPDPVRLEPAAGIVLAPGDRVRCRIVDPPLLKATVVGCVPAGAVASR